MSPAPAGSRLSGGALAFRALHTAVAGWFLFAIGYVWWCALSGRRGSLLRIAVGTLIAEGLVVAVNRGDCPLGPLQDRLGDPVPLFELVLSPSAAKRAVPVLGLVAAAGIGLLRLSSAAPPRRGRRARGRCPGRRRLWSSPRPAAG